VNIIHLHAVPREDPTPADLAAIEAEMPLIEAELDVLDAEIALITAGPAASVLDRRRVRRAERRALATRRELTADQVQDGAA
jgi:cob(I)alamin adenosyltransferase